MNGQWTEPQNLGPLVNSYTYDYGPWVDETNSLLYFNSYRRGKSDIYRVDLADIPALQFILQK